MKLETCTLKNSKAVSLQENKQKKLKKKLALFNSCVTVIMLKPFLMYH